MYLFFAHINPFNLFLTIAFDDGTRNNGTRNHEKEKESY
jgi:hypothetical protein